MSFSSSITSSTVARPAAFDPRSVMAILGTQQAAERLRADESARSAGAVMSVIAELRQIIQEQAASIRNLESRVTVLGAQLENKEVLHKAETEATQAENKTLKEQLCKLEVAFQTHIHNTPGIGCGYTGIPTPHWRHQYIAPDHIPIPTYIEGSEALLKTEAKESQKRSYLKDKAAAVQTLMHYPSVSPVNRETLAQLSSVRKGY